LLQLDILRRHFRLATHPPRDGDDRGSFPGSVLTASPPLLLLLCVHRVFYKEWWNAATLADYWKLWNIPVHAWMLRTLYFPMVRRKWGRWGSARGAGWGSGVGRMWHVKREVVFGVRQW
jgi:hypothetical protein